MTLFVKSYISTIFLFSSQIKCIYICFHWTFPFCFQTIQVWSLWEGFHAEAQLEGTCATACRGTSLQMWRMWKRLHTQENITRAHASAHRYDGKQNNVHCLTIRLKIFTVPITSNHVKSQFYVNFVINLFSRSCLDL